jgi:hypothetical protein
MPHLTYTIDIKAPAQKVWDVMLADETYRQWTTPFQGGSYYEGNWDKGSNIRFVAMYDGKLSGMFSKIIKNRPYEFISVEHLGEVIDGQNVTDSENAKQWAGAHENYTFSEAGGMTALTVTLEGESMSAEMAEMFDGMWPKALKKLKEIVEKQ